MLTVLRKDNYNVAPILNATDGKKVGQIDSRLLITKIAQFLVSFVCKRRKEVDMNVSIGERWEAFVDAVVREGRYGSASEVVREGLRLVEEREAKLKALRATLDASIDAGGEASDADIDSALEAKASQLAKEGF
jgi:antitoxin ParD1/3/4